VERCVEMEKALSSRLLHEGRNFDFLVEGTLEQGEPPLECVARELREETGYEAKELEPLLSCFMAPGYSDEVIYFFVARGLSVVGVDPEIDEEITLELHSLEEVRRMIAENVIEDAKTIVGILSMKE
jgi:ADP-ribose pyrophosphatase